MNNSDYQQRVKHLLPGGVHYNFRLPWDESPIHFNRSKASRLWDLSDKEYLDLNARFGAQIIGHGHLEYTETLKDTIDRILCVSHSDLDADVLEQLSQHIPSAEMIRFGLSGTEIVQNALRLARAYTGKNKFIRFEGHYHGNADNIMGGQIKRGCTAPTEYIGDMKGTAGRAKGTLEDQSFLLPWNDTAALEACLDQHANHIAAIITEPVCVNGGSIEPKPGYLASLRSLCDRHGIVLIFDEIITGVRMGLGGAQAAYGVTPDLTTLGKAIAGGGLPVSALVGKREIMQLLTEKKVTHAGTFNGYSLGMAAIKATFHILSRNNQALLKTMNNHATRLHNILLDVASTVGLPLIIQGPPACAAFHCTNKPFLETSEYTYEIMSYDIILNHWMQQNNILVSTFSRLYPNISLNQDDLDWFQHHIKGALESTKSIYDEMTALT